MKKIALLSLSLLMAPAMASAQSAETGPPTAETGPPAPSAAMIRMHEQLEQAHLQVRSQILGALTAAHRTLLANVVGGLAISPSPNIEAAAKELDAALSPQESRAILDAEASLHAQMRAAMQALEASGDAPKHGPPLNESRPRRTPDAGFTLIRTALGFGGPMRPHGL
jgi:hypothetical protein